jgi:hypothetical protein
VQVAPLSPVAQSQVNCPSSTPSTQRPPLAQDAGVQALTFTSQRVPVNPVRLQLQINAPGVGPSVQVLRAQGRPLQALASLPQLGPSKPVPVQSQVVPLTPSMQRPPFKQDEVEQSFTIFSQRAPLKPVPEQLQVKARRSSRQRPPFEHEAAVQSSMLI